MPGLMRKRKMKVDELECKKCHRKFMAMVPQGAKWVECPFCKEMTKIS
jgi:LSD1 subclass zinc finger protein